MSQELLSLIGQATGRRVRWDDVVVMNNVALIPPVQDTPGDFVWNRGFNVVVLNRLGSPKFFCKCRSLHDERLAHETTSMLALRNTSGLEHYIPPTYQAQSEKIRVLITRFLSGQPLNALLDGPRHGRMTNIVVHALDCVVELNRTSTTALPDSVLGCHLDLVAEAAGLLEHLCKMGLPESDAQTMRYALDAGNGVSRQLQHGDLWPANVMKAGKKLWFLDFEMFGRVQVPMYDVFHFLRTCADGWALSGQPAWMDEVQNNGVSSDLLRAQMRRIAEKLGLSVEQSVAVLVFYVAHFSVTTHRRNPEGQVWKLFFQEAKLLADHIRQGHVEQLFRGSVG